jgi:integrase
MPVQRLTQKDVDDLSRGGQPRLIRDTQVKGLMVAVGRTGASYKIQADLYQDRKLVGTRARVLGSTTDLKLKEAQRQARALLDEIKRGVDINATATPEAASGVATVEQMFVAYAAYLEKKGAAERTLKDMKYRREKYLGDWLPLPVTAIKGKTCEQRHAKITEDNGPRIANQLMMDFRAAYNRLLKKADDDAKLPSNPAKKVDLNPEKAKDHSVTDLARWWKRLQLVESPSRRAMIELGLFSGLRPGTVASLQRAWVNLDKKAICIPKMKADGEFHLPLSEHMVGIVKRALEAGHMLYPGAPWLFPTRSDKTGEITHAQTWDDRHLPGETGHILRHTYKTMANAADVSDFDSRVLMHHKIGGMSGNYLHLTNPEVFARYLGLQERVSQFILARCAPPALAIAAE